MTAAAFDEQTQKDFLKAVWKNLLFKFPDLRYEQFHLDGFSEVALRRLNDKLDATTADISRRLSVELEVDYSITYIAEEIGCSDCEGFSRFGHRPIF